MNLKGIAFAASIPSLWLLLVAAGASVPMNTARSPEVLDKIKLIQMTRYYERLYHTTPFEITFVEVGAKKQLYCAMSGNEYNTNGGVADAGDKTRWNLRVTYDLNCRRGTVIPNTDPVLVVDERVFARHEVLHHYFRHYGPGSRACKFDADYNEIVKDGCITMGDAEAEVQAFRGE